MEQQGNVTKKAQTIESVTKYREVGRAKAGFTFFGYGLESFGVIGLELLLVYVIEPMIYHRPMQEFTKAQIICHWVVTCLLWGLGAWAVIRDCRKSCGVDLWANVTQKKLFGEAGEIRIGHWMLILAGVVCCLVSTWIDWNGSKVLAEFQKKGPLLFSFQYIYYLFEVVLVLLVIVFGQMAFETWFNAEQIPFGGILVALTWGLGHWMTKGSLATGLYTAIGGLVFGSVYLWTNRNVKLSYLLLCIMFIL